MRKAEKRDLLDQKQKFHLNLDQKIDKAEVHGLLSDFTSDQAQKSFGFRKELFEKISSIQQDITTSVTQFVQISELEKLLDTKADVEIIQQINGSKATVQDLDSTRKMVERLGFEIDNRPGFKDLEGHVAHTKGLVEDLTKELMLKASIKDLCSLLD